MPSAPPPGASPSNQTANSRRTISTQNIDKENRTWEPWGRLSTSGSQPLRDEKQDSTCQRPPQPSLPPSGSQQKQCPQTPANRIPLADLIGNTEDAFNCDPKDPTPEDHIYWQHGPTPRSSIPSTAAGSTRRRRKRAQYSSPETSFHSNNKSPRPRSTETLDLETLHESLKTPVYNDPAVDLWARYTDASLGTGDAEAKARPTFAHLMTSSPQTPGTMNGKDGLRRSISCGIVWPTSKAKRRKVGHEMVDGRVRDLFAASKGEIMAVDKPKASRISLLMEKLQENSVKIPEKEASGPSSSSPLPDRIGIPNVPQASPVSQRMLPSQNEENTLPDRENKGPARDEDDDDDDDKITTSRQSNRAEDQSSDFGDEDLGLDDLEAVEQSTSTQMALAAAAARRQPFVSSNASHTRHSSTSHQHITSQSYDTRPTTANYIPVDADGSNTGRTGRGSTSKVGLEDRNDFGDEFGDGSDDSGAMADLAARYDTQEMPRQQAQHLSQYSSPSEECRPAIQKTTTNEEDLYGNDDDDELWDEKRSNKRAIKRYLIVEVVESQFVNARGSQQPERVCLSCFYIFFETTSPVTSGFIPPGFHLLTRLQVLSIKDEKSGKLKVILLRQSWLHSRCTSGAYVHLIGDFDRLGQCIVDDGENMIILHPDHLISATVVADSFSCTRRAVLQDRIKATGAAEPAQVYGHILHEVFGRALNDNNWSANHLRAITEEILSNWIEPLYEINTQVPQAVDYLMSKMPQLQAWASIFVNADARPQGEVRDRNGSLSSMNVNKLLAVEEHIWSPLYGLKGNVDATVQVGLVEANEPRTKTLTVPLEFKTGKKDNNETHRAQTELYTLLLSDRYDVDVTCGVLYYLETSKTFRVQAIRNEIRHMVIQRNELAGYVRNKLELPPMVKKPFLCNNCYAQTACFTYHKLTDGGDGETSGLKEKFDDAVKHLQPVHQTFFRKWDELLTKEERDAMKFRRELWTMLSDEREALGRCFGRVYIEPGSAVESLDGPKINRYQYAFLKESPRAGFSFIESQLTVGEPIVVSDEDGHFALANGYITTVWPDRLAVAVDRKLHNVRKRCAGFDPATNQVFNGIMDVADGGSSKIPAASSSLPQGEGDGMLYRVDKDEFSNGMATVRNNLIRIMEKDLFKARELRELIVEGRPPSFRPSGSQVEVGAVSSQHNDLNVDQTNAIDKVMRAKDYALVLGMPGTGKTTTIAQIIRALVAQNKSVLLTSYTHTAVDNILLKIKDDGIPILRLGAVAKVHPDVQSFATLGGRPKKTLAELEDSYVNSKVVASTCLGVNHAIFNTRIFDYCIVDEASQITLPTCLGPIRMARTFILVGDHYQLPPLVQNREAQEGGLDISLFKMLSDRQPDSVVNLEHQYRMAEDIMLLSNTLIYNGRLKCGTSTVAERTLAVPDLEEGLAVHHHHHHRRHHQPDASSSCSLTSSSSICVPSPSTDCWLRHALTPSSRCLFLNTDQLPSPHDITKGSRITNPTEARLVAQLVHTLLSSGVPGRSIGVITFYRSQLALLRQTLHQPEQQQQQRPSQLNDIEMHTADKFQGRDKEVIILSCVRSSHRDAGSTNNKNSNTNNTNTNNNSNNNNNNIGDLLRDWRRVNVALTRAKSKLLIVGSKATLRGSGNETLTGLVDVMERREGWMVELPRCAEVAHRFGFMSSSPSPSSLALDMDMDREGGGDKRSDAKVNEEKSDGSGKRKRDDNNITTSSPSSSPSKKNTTTITATTTTTTTTTTTPGKILHPRNVRRPLLPNKHFDGNRTVSGNRDDDDDDDGKGRGKGRRSQMMAGAVGAAGMRVEKLMARNAVLRDVVRGV